MGDETISAAFTVENRAWLDAMRYKSCAACGIKDGTIVGAHIRTGLEGGTAKKPSDDLVVPLCHSCHADQEKNIGANWWFEKVFKRMVRLSYTRYLEIEHDGEKGGL